MYLKRVLTRPCGWDVFCLTHQLSEHWAGINSENFPRYPTIIMRMLKSGLDLTLNRGNFIAQYAGLESRQTPTSLGRDGPKISTLHVPRRIRGRNKLLLALKGFGTFMKGWNLPSKHRQRQLCSSYMAYWHTTLPLSIKLKLVSCSKAGFSLLLFLLDMYSSCSWLTSLVIITASSCHSAV